MINSVTIIGSGRVGTSIASYGMTELRNDATLARFNRVVVSARVFCEDPESTAIPKSDVIVLATRDSFLEEVITKMTLHHADILQGSLVLHVNGSLGADILEPLTKHGAHVSAAHPFQTFSKPDPALLTGIGWGVDCDEASWPLTEEFVRLLRGFPLRLPKTDPVSKRRYHAAAVAASNFTYAAYDLARRLAEDVGIPPAQFLAPIMRQTLENALEAIAHNTPFPITGPLVRGDMEAVQRQLDAMPMHLKDTYVHLTEALRKTVRREE